MAEREQELPPPSAREQELKLLLDACLKFGASGPANINEAAARAIEKHQAARAELARVREQSAALATMVTRLIDADGRAYQSGALCEATPFTKQLRAAADAVLGAGAQGKYELPACDECAPYVSLACCHRRMGHCDCECHHERNRVPADTGEGAKDG